MFAFSHCQRREAEVILPFHEDKTQTTALVTVIQPSSCTLGYFTLYVMLWHTYGPKLTSHFGSLRCINYHHLPVIQICSLGMSKQSVEGIISVRRPVLAGFWLIWPRKSCGMNRFSVVKLLPVGTLQGNLFSPHFT